MPVVFKTTKIAGRAQEDPLLYEILRDLGMMANRAAADIVNASAFLVPRGGIIMWPGPIIPAGFLLCNGAAISRTNYAALYAVVGTSYGVGDGGSTFNLPDFRQKFPLGVAASGTGSTLAGTGGTIDHVHAVNPPRTDSAGPSATVLVDNSATTLAVASQDHVHEVDIASFNSGTANPPFLSINFIIKT